MPDRRRSRSRDDRRREEIHHRDRRKRSPSPGERDRRRYRDDSRRDRSPDNRPHRRDDYRDDRRRSDDYDDRSRSRDRHRNDKARHDRVSRPDRDEDRHHDRDREQRHAGRQRRRPDSGSASPRLHDHHHRVKRKEGSRSRSPSIPAVKGPERPNFGTSGLLSAASRRDAATGVVLKYQEPSDAARPARGSSWVLTIFADDSGASTPAKLVHLSEYRPSERHRNTVDAAGSSFGRSNARSSVGTRGSGVSGSAGSNAGGNAGAGGAGDVVGGRSVYLIGRDALVCDIHIDDGSCSKQHAVIQFRATAPAHASAASSAATAGGTVGAGASGGGGGGISAASRDLRAIAAAGGFAERQGRPYLMDLDSTNGSLLNGDAIPKGRYIELRNGDVMRFGDAAQDYVLVCE